MSIGLLKLREIITGSLSDRQTEVLKECVVKENGVLATHVGFGKTRTSIAIGLSHGRLIAVVVSKSLVSSWMNEIKKVFGDKIRVSVVAAETAKKMEGWYPIITEGEGDNSWSVPHIVLITPEYISLKYKKINPNFVGVIRTELLDGWRRIYYYDTVTMPVLTKVTGPLSIFSVVWDCLIVDEVQDYLNIQTPRTRTICSIAAKHRWALSATPIRNPKIMNILGLYCIINYPCPRSIEQMDTYCRNDAFKGLSEISIIREAEPPSYKIVDTIITHGMFKEEVLVYTMFRNIVRAINKELELAVETEDKVRLGASLLTVVGYMRQSILSPVLPIATIAISCIDTNVSNISAKLNEEINNLALQDWLNDESSVLSSRIKSIIDTLAIVKDERVIVFFANRTSIDLFRHFVKERDTFTIASSMNSEVRGETLSNFEATSNGVLVLTYKLGSQGLNLQNQRTIFLGELDWSNVSTHQAIGRVNRPGQEKDVHIYRFTSGTGVEHLILNKQLKKATVTSELMVGKIRGTLGVRESRKLVCAIIDTKDNVKVMQKLRS